MGAREFSATASDGFYGLQNGTIAPAWLCEANDVESNSMRFVQSSDTKTVAGTLGAEGPQVLLLYGLATKRLATPMSVIVEPDGDGYLAQTVDLPLYGFGDSFIESVDMLKAEIESLHHDLNVDDNFSDDFLRRKKFLNKIVIAE